MDEITGCLVTSIDQEAERMINPIEVK